MASTIVLAWISYFVARTVFDLGQPKSYNNIPGISSLTAFRIFLKKLSFADRYKSGSRKFLEEYGIMRMNLFGRRMVILGSPEYARQLLINTDDFPKVVPSDSQPKSLAARFFGVNLVFSNGDVWKRHRKISNPAFHRSWSTEVFGERAEAMVKAISAELKENPEIPVHSYCQRMTLDALGKAAFGYDINSIENPDGEYVVMYNKIIRGSFSALYFFFPWLDGIPFFRRKSTFNAIDDFDKLMYQIIDAKKEKLKMAKESGISTKDDDLLSLMIKANEGGEDLTDEELRANMVVFFLAGHDTTANALACALYYVAKYPEIQERLYKEITDILGPATEEGIPPTPTMEEARDMKLLNAVMKETMRLHPSVGQLPARHVEHDVQVGPYTIPAGTEVTVSIYSIHHNPKYWDAPEEFRPQRFEDAAADIDADGGIVGGKRDPLAWVPFSYGTRSCIGMNFSLIEQRVVLSMLVHKFKLSLPDDSVHKDSLKFNTSGLTAPLDLKIKFEPRY